jgi:hypothetical protein
MVPMTSTVSIVHQANTSSTVVVKPPAQLEPSQIPLPRPAHNLVPQVSTPTRTPGLVRPVISRNVLLAQLPQLPVPLVSLPNSSTPMESATLHPPAPQEPTPIPLTRFAPSVTQTVPLVLDPTRINVPSVDTTDTLYLLSPTPVYSPASALNQASLTPLPSSAPAVLLAVPLVTE